MNLFHSWVCSSSRWQRRVEQLILPWALEDVDLGSDVLEVGPGYGATTEVLRRRAAQLTSVEVDPTLANHLRSRFQSGNVKVLCEDATKMSLPDASFEAAVSFTMLHHVPSTNLQDRLLAEVWRTLRPGGIFAESDGLDSGPFRLMHLFDTVVVIDPETFPDRLRAVGFQDVKIEINQHIFRFRARKPLEN